MYFLGFSMLSSLSSRLNSANIRYLMRRPILNNHVNAFYTNVNGNLVFDVKKVSNTREVTSTLKLALKYKKKTIEKQASLNERKDSFKIDKYNKVCKFIADYQSYVFNDMNESVKNIDDQLINLMKQHLEMKNIDLTLFHHQLKTKNKFNEFRENILNYCQYSQKYQLNIDYLDQLIEEDFISSCCNCFHHIYQKDKVKDINVIYMGNYIQKVLVDMNYDPNQNKHSLNEVNIQYGRQEDIDFQYSRDFLSFPEIKMKIFWSMMDSFCANAQLMDVEGIFRVSCNQKELNDATMQVNQKILNKFFEIKFENIGVFTYCSLMKQLLKESIDQSAKENFLENFKQWNKTGLNSVDLSYLHSDIVRLARNLNQIAQNHEKNKMDAHNLAIVFVGLLLDDSPKKKIYFTKTNQIEIQKEVHKKAAQYFSQIIALANDSSELGESNDSSDSTYL